MSPDPAEGSLLITPELIRAYHDAVGVAVDAGVAPLLSIVAGYPLLFGTVASVTPSTLHGRIVHGDHEVTVVRQVRAGDVLRASASVEAISASRPGTAVAVRIDIVGAHGGLVAVHRAVAIVRGARPEAEIGSPRTPPEPEPADWTGMATVAIGPDQPARYAAATGDRNAVHLDVEAARRAGFPGVIAHGLGVFGLALGVLVEHVARGDQGLVHRARVRFGSPVRPSQELTVQWASSDRVAFRALDASGAAVLRSGLLELH